MHLLTGALQIAGKQLPHGILVFDYQH